MSNTNNTTSTVSVIKVLRKTNKKFTPKVDVIAMKEAKSSHGLIRYDQRTSSRPVAIDFRGETLFMSKPLSAGNSKLGKDILIFDILAQITCPDCAKCVLKCYALRDQRLYKPTFNARLMRTHLAVHHLEFLEKLIRDQLARDKGKHPYVRIHSSGDFFSPEYTAMWERIADDFPNVTFYCYTKSPFAPRPCSRIVVVPSFDSKGRVNFGDLKTMEERAKEEGGIVCPVAYNKKTGCGGGRCYHCMKKNAKTFFQAH